MRRIAEMRRRMGEAEARFRDSPEARALVGELPEIVIEAGLVGLDEVEGAPVFLTPVCDPVTVERVALLAWHPATPRRWQIVAGDPEAPALGLIPPQYLDPEPVRVWRTPLALLRAAGDGICFLTADTAAIRHILLFDCRGGVIAESQAHAAELRRICARPYPLPAIRAA